MERTMSQRLLAEFVGTFTLIFIGAGAVVADANQLGVGLVGVALAHGLAIATMVSAVGHVSGGHFNPAVTLGALVTSKISGKDALGYITAQLAGGAAGAGVLRGALPEAIWRPSNLGATVVNGSLSNGPAVLIEAVLTFFLVWVIFATAMDPEGSFGKVAGLAIGLVITMDVLMGGAWTGAAMNPARWFGPALVGGTWANWWVWIVGPVAGAWIAAVLYDMVILAPRAGAGSAAPDEVPDQE